MNIKEIKKMAAYIEKFIEEEIIRGNIEVDKWMIEDAIKAYLGGAYEQV